LNKQKIFLASSEELKQDRREFEIFINRKNKDWVDRGVFLELVLWEDFLDAVSRSRLQDEYNQAIRECDIFVMLFFTKVGPYTEEEFETAFGQFEATNKPFIFTYFKDSKTGPAGTTNKDQTSLAAFQHKLDALGHFYTRYPNIDALKLHFGRQLDKLATNGFIEFKPDREDTAAHGANSYHADLDGSGAIAQGPNATAVGAGGVVVGGNNTGNINTGTKIDTGGAAYVGGNVTVHQGDFVGRDKFTQGVSPGELASLFAPLLDAITQQVPADQRTDAVKHVEDLKVEVARDKDADDSKIAGIIEGLAKMVPGAIGTIVNMFATPILNGIAGPVTAYVLQKLKGG